MEDWDEYQRTKDGQMIDMADLEMSEENVLTVWEAKPRGRRGSRSTSGSSDETAVGGSMDTNTEGQL